MPKNIHLIQKLFSFIGPIGFNSVRILSKTMGLESHILSHKSDRIPAKECCKFEGIVSHALSWKHASHLSKIFFEPSSNCDITETHSEYFSAKSLKDLRAS